MQLHAFCIPKCKPSCIKTASSRHQHVLFQSKYSWKKKERNVGSRRDKRKKKICSKSGLQKGEFDQQIPNLYTTCINITN